MKTEIIDLQSALAAQLEAMHDAEELILAELLSLSQGGADPQLKKLLKDYAKSSRNKRLKLKRMFSYVLRGPFFIKGNPVKEIIKSLSDIAKRSTKNECDLLFASRLLATAQFKLSIYQTALEMAVYLALEEVTHLLNEIISQEELFISDIRTAVSHACNTEAHVDD